MEALGVRNGRIRKEDPAGIGGHSRHCWRFFNQCCVRDRVRPAAWWWAWWWRLAWWAPWWWRLAWWWPSWWRLAWWAPWRYRHRRGGRAWARGVRARQRAWRFVSLSVLRLLVSLLW